jgi:hypothetical protein
VRSSLTDARTRRLRPRAAAVRVMLLAAALLALVARVAAYFRRTLPSYAPYAWAVSVGNEQDLVQGAAGSARKYRAVWNAVEPVVARVAPRAIRVYGEPSAFDFPFLEASFVGGRPRGAHVIAFHCYDVKNGGLSVVPQVAAWAATKRLPLPSRPF